MNSPMRAEIKSLHSPDIADLARYTPDESDNFGFLLQLMAGPVGEPGEESFDILVCTPRWLTEKYRTDEIIDGRHTLIMFEYDYPRLVKKLERAVQYCTGENWREVGTKLGRMGKWEFEDYVEYKE